MVERKELLNQYLEGVTRLEATINGLTSEELDFKPGQEKWSIREVIIHLADSEVNAFLRYRSIISEPGKKAFVVDEASWAKALNYQQQLVGEYLQLFKLLRSITYHQLILLPNTDELWKSRCTIHEYLGRISLEKWLELYVQHVETHINQIKRNLKQFRENAGKASEVA